MIGNIEHKVLKLTPNAALNVVPSLRASFLSSCKKIEADSHLLFFAYLLNSFPITLGTTLNHNEL